jgi:hypothetical protein
MIKFVPVLAGSFRENRFVQRTCLPPLDAAQHETRVELCTREFFA